MILSVNVVHHELVGKSIHLAIAEKWLLYSPNWVSMDFYWAESTIKIKASDSKQKPLRWFGKQAIILVTNEKLYSNTIRLHFIIIFLGNATDLFTSVMYNTYGPPPGFCFDILCSDEPIIDDKKSPLYNVPQRLKLFFDYLDNVTKAYSTSNVIITMGEDFNYQDATVWYKNLDKLI